MTLLIPRTGRAADDLGRNASESRRALLSTVRDVEPIPLDAAMEGAALQTRVDRKFLLTPHEFTRLITSLGRDFRVLEIDGRRIFRYESIYFDTPDLQQFRAHRQGRRKRFKVRTRTYADSGICMFEAKIKGYRGETVKHRIPYALNDRARLTGEANAFLGHHLTREYGTGLPQLKQVLRTDYARATFVDPVNHERVTCDVDLVCSNNQRSVNGPDLIVVETKTAHGRGASDRALAAMGIRAVSMSKYCVGIALLHPHLAANRWSRLLRTRFGWSRDVAGETQTSRRTLTRD